MYNNAIQSSGLTHQTYISGIPCCSIFKELWNLNTNHGDKALSPCTNFLLTTCIISWKDVKFLSLKKNIYEIWQNNEVCPCFMAWNHTVFYSHLNHFRTLSLFAATTVGTDAKQNYTYRHKRFSGEFTVLVCESRSLTVSHPKRTRKRNAEN